MEPGLLARSRLAETEQRIIGEFFFVYAPEARTLADQGPNGQPQRAYEFLHATFGGGLASWTAARAKRGGFPRIACVVRAGRSRNGCKPRGGTGC